MKLLNSFGIYLEFIGMIFDISAVWNNKINEISKYKQQKSSPKYVINKLRKKWRLEKLIFVGQNQFCMQFFDGIIIIRERFMEFRNGFGFLKKKTNCK